MDRRAPLPFDSDGLLSHIVFLGTDRLLHPPDQLLSTRRQPIGSVTIDSNLRAEFSAPFLYLLGFDLGVSLTHRSGLIYVAVALHLAGTEPTHQAPPDRIPHLTTRYMTPSPRGRSSESIGVVPGRQNASQPGAPVHDDCDGAGGRRQSGAHRRNQGSRGGVRHRWFAICKRGSAAPAPRPRGAAGARDPR